MPVLPVFKFHTKLIQSILDPVAQQVSQLVIVHEEAAEGKIVHDLTSPVQAVDAAVQNLVVVGKQTLGNTKDEQLKIDMPPTFEQVGDASKTLLEASKGIAEDPFSKPHKNMLLDGARGILQGVSGLLLVFDQGEVRKMVKACNGIIEYLQVAEVVQTIDELVQFTKNLSGGMTSMTKQVSARQEDLTNPSHSSILADELEQIKRALPLLLSSIKAYVTLKQAKRDGVDDAQENRNYIVLAMTESLKEIIRVLQLTSPTEEQGALASSTGGQQTGLPGGILPGTLAAKVFEAKSLLGKTGKDAEVNRAGILAVESVLKEAKRIAKTLSADKRAAIEKLCAEIDALSKELAELQARGEGDSERARAIAKLIGEKMDQLERQLQLELTKKIAEDFKDPVGPLNALSAAALASLDTPNRAENYAAKSETFQVHARKMAETASSLARSGVVTDRKLADDLISTAKKVKALAPQIVHASKIVFANPDNEAAKEHFQKLKEDYRAQVEKLTELVDGGVDTVDFIAVSEEKIKDDLEKAKAITKAGTNSQAAFAHVASAARTTNRVVAVTKGEAENSTDVDFKAKLDSSSGAVTSAIAPMVQGAQAAIAKPGNVAVQENFEAKSDQLVSAVHDVFDVVDKQYNPPPPPPRPPSPTPEAPPVVPPRPPSPVEEVPTKAEDPIGFAAHQLDKDAKQWENNAMVEAARKMAKLMMQMAKYTKGEAGEVGSKKDLINTARLIAKESEEVIKMAKKVAAACTDKRMKRAVLQVVDKIPTIATQLKIISTVKATRQGGNDPEADQEASEMLTNNAENLMSAVSEVLFATEAATIRVPPGEREKLGLQWVKRS